jgi:VWFA-related protein
VPVLHSRRLYVLIFDLAFSSPAALSRARNAAYEYVARAGPADVFSVGVFSAVKGLQLMVPFTRDRDIVRLAIKNLKPVAQDDPLHLALGPVERAELVTPKGYEERPEVQEMIDDSAAKELSLMPARQRIIDEMASLGDFADRLALIEGNRHVVLLTSGFDAALAHGGSPANRIEFPVNFGANAQVDRAPMRGSKRIGMSEPLITAGANDMYARFNRAGVFLDCIDVEGVRLSFGSYAQSEGLSVLARGTGGQVILNRNNLVEAMQTLADRQRIVYVLGFHAADTGKRQNKLSVKLRGVDGRVDVSHRPSYSSSLPSTPTSDGLRIADILENDIAQNGLTTSIAASGKRVDVIVPARELIALGKDAEVMLYVYAGQNVVAFTDKRISIDAARADAAKPVHVVESFDALPPGRYMAKVLVRFDGVDALGFARTPMTVE